MILLLLWLVVVAPANDLNNKYFRIVALVLGSLGWSAK